MNKQLEQMKAALVEYRTAARKIREEMDKNSKMLNAEYAKAENSKLLEKLESKRRSALASIDEATAAGLASVKEWARLDGNKLTSDAQLLNNGLVSPNSYEEMINRYKDNGTMLTLLRQYGESQNRAGDKNSPKFNTAMIPTQQDRENAYKSFGAMARDFMNRLDEKGAFAGLDSAMINGAIDTFGEPTPMSADALELIF